MKKMLISAIVAPALLLGCRPATPVQEIRDKQDSVRDVEIVVNDDEWSRWRGPRQDGISRDQDPPFEWSENQHIVWSSPVPGRGHSSPIVVGDQIFLTTADGEKEEQQILCYDRNSGEPRWTTTAHRGGFARMHSKNSQASATPAWDGEQLIAAFVNSDALWLTAVDADGNILWQQDAGPFHSEHGYGSSPTLFKSLVIVCGDNAESSFLAALDRSSGEIIWRVARERPGSHGSYGTPVVADIAGQPQLLLAGHGKLTSYNPENGDLLWYCDGPSEVAACTVAVSDEVVFASGGYPEKEIMAVRGDGSGDVSSSHVIWRGRKVVTYVPSPVYHEGRLYVVNDSGITACFDGESGDVLWRKRLGGSFSASPTLVNGKLVAANESGTTFVIGTEPQYKLLAQNELGDGCFASPAICGGRVYLRSTDTLFCIGE